MSVLQMLRGCTGSGKEVADRSAASNGPAKGSSRRPLSVCPSSQHERRKGKASIGGEERTYSFLRRKLPFLKLGIRPSLALGRHKHVLDRRHGRDRQDLLAAPVLLRVEQLEEEEKLKKGGGGANERESGEECSTERVFGSANPIKKYAQGNSSGRGRRVERRRSGEGREKTHDGSHHGVDRHLRHSLPLGPRQPPTLINRS